MRKLSGQSLYIGAVAAVSLAVVVWVLLSSGDEAEVAAQPGRTGRPLDKIPFDGAQAYAYLQQLCAFGPRPSGSAAMKAQQELLVDHFQKLGAVVERQEFTVRHPQDGSPVKLANLVVHWHPQRAERLLLLAHYDTRPFPDRDPRNKRGRFVGANDGGSGVALLMELGRALPALPGRVGVDFLLVDGEEFVFQDPPDKYFLGATHFAEQYRSAPPKHRYRAGVLLDMIGDARLTIPIEPRSARVARETVDSLWSVARRLGVREFVVAMGPEVNDDHVPLNEIAQIPTIDLIDFDYPYWHTEQDVPENCSPLSLARVGWVLHEWLKQEAAAPPKRGP